jgi:hypothetical protein
VWKGRTKTATVIIGAEGTIKKVFDKKLQLLPDHPLVIDVQKITLVSKCTHS